MLPGSSRRPRGRKLLLRPHSGVSPISQLGSLEVPRETQDLWLSDHLSTVMGHRILNESDKVREKESLDSLLRGNRLPSTGAFSWVRGFETPMSPPFSCLLDLPTNVYAWTVPIHRMGRSVPGRRRRTTRVDSLLS